MSREKEVDQETRAQLTALVIEFNWKLDRGLPAGFGDLFTGEGVFIAAGNERRGKTELDDFARARTAQDKTSRTILGLPRLRWSGPDEVRGTVPYTLFMHSGSGQPVAQVFAVGEYEDVYRHEDGQWRIASRQSTQVFKG
ncbi:nuclear transport factor 2 family protein [Arthrobacter sp. 2MCAF15]|jgi:uncharacterized protein (TIGR02246 family)|uniref:nuclear transport factor 2 family protein n=1 Tax=Arthrobacter sp. 2MCAF15 TaxID=3232984 RepID=UPI003F8FB128